MDPHTHTVGTCENTHTHGHMAAHTQSPLPGHFALERAEKLMRVQSFITLETERETRGRVKRARVIQCPPCAAVAMGTPISPWELTSEFRSPLASCLDWNTTQLLRAQTKHAVADKQ